MQANGHGCLPIELDLQTFMVGQIWPTGCGLQTLLHTWRSPSTRSLDTVYHRHCSCVTEGNPFTSLVIYFPCNTTEAPDWTISDPLGFLNLALELFESGIFLFLLSVGVWNYRACQGPSLLTHLGIYLVSKPHHAFCFFLMVSFQAAPSLTHFLSYWEVAL